MTTYRVKFSRTGRTSERVEAKKFEVEEGGVLVFYEDPDKTGSLGEMTADNKIRAFSNWDEVKRV